MSKITTQDLMDVIRGEEEGWKVEESNNEDGDGIGELHIYPSDYKHGNFFYTVYNYPEEFWLYRSFFKSNSSISETLLGEYKSTRNLIKAVIRDIKYYSK